MTAPARNVKRRDVKAERPLIDMPTVWGSVDHRKPVLIDPHRNYVWIRLEVAPHQHDVTKRGGEEQVGSSALRDEESSNLRAICDKVLRRRRVVIIIKRINLGAMVEQESSDFNGAREMQRPLAIATFCMDEGRITCDQGRQLWQHPKIGRSPDVDLGPAGNQRSGLIRGHLFQHAEAAVLPAGPSIEIGAMRKIGRA